MIVCHCQVVSDHEIQDAIAHGATSECAIAEACGAGRTCGGCLPEVRGLLAQRGLPTDPLLDASAIRARLRDVLAPAGDLAG